MFCLSFRYFISSIISSCSLNKNLFPRRGASQKVHLYGQPVLTITVPAHISVLYLSGFLDAHTAPKFEDGLQSLIKEERVLIIVNHQDLDYISSAGLGVFMGFIEEIRNKGGDIKLSNMSQKVFKVFDLLGFPALFEIFDEEEQAKAKYNETK